MDQTIGTALIEALKAFGSASAVFLILWLWLREKNAQLEALKQERDKSLDAYLALRDRYEGLLTDRLADQDRDLAVLQRAVSMLGWNEPTTTGQEKSKRSASG